MGAGKPLTFKEKKAAEAARCLDLLLKQGPHRGSARLALKYVAVTDARLTPETQQQIADVLLKHNGIVGEKFVKEFMPECFPK